MGSHDLARINRISYNTVLEKGDKIIVYQVTDPTRSDRAEEQWKKTPRAVRNKVTGKVDDTAKPAEAKKADAKPAEAKKADAKPAEAKKADAKPAEAKKADAKPAEAKKADAKPAEAKPAEAKPAEAKPGPAPAKPAVADVPVTSPTQVELIIPPRALVSPVSSRGTRGGPRCHACRSSCSDCCSSVAWEMAAGPRPPTRP